MPRRQRHSRRRFSMLAFKYLLFDLGDRLRRIEVLRTGLGAVHDGVAAIQPEWIFQVVESFSRRLVTAVDDPAIRRQQGRGSQIAIAVPPVARARGRAAGAQDAGRGTVDLFLVFPGLRTLAVRR